MITIIRCGTIHCGMLQPSARGMITIIRCGTIRCGTIHCGTIRCGTIRCGTIHCGTIHCGTIRCGTIHCGMLQPSARFSSYLIYYWKTMKRIHLNIIFALTAAVFTFRHWKAFSSEMDHNKLIQQSSWLAIVSDIFTESTFHTAYHRYCRVYCV